MCVLLCRSVDYGLMFQRVNLRTLDSAIYRFPNSTTVGLFNISDKYTVFIYMYVSLVVSK